MSSLIWRKSSRSGSGANECVELAIGESATYIRDTKDRDGATLCVNQHSWAGFLARVKAGHLDRWDVGGANGLFTSPIEANRPFAPSEQHAGVSRGLGGERT